MRKKILILFMLFSTFSYTKIIKLASFNAKRLGQSTKDRVTFSNILKKFDIIALEEVIKKDALRDIVDRLGPTYSYIVSKPVGTSKYKEYFAIVYKKNVVNQIKDLGVYKEKRNEFIREPSAFYIKSNKLDFIAIPVHSIFGENEKQRAAEASKYIDVYKYFYNMSKQDDIIFMGDFNLPANDKAFDNLKEIGYYNILNPIYDKTTLSDKGLANSYDNFFIMLKNTKAFKNRYGVYNFTKNGNYKQIREYISDHLLVYVELDNEED